MSRTVIPTAVVLALAFAGAAAGQSGPVWSKTVEGAYGFAARGLPGGGFVIAHTLDVVPPRAVVSRLAASGAVVWSQEIVGTRIVEDFRPHPDGSIYVLGDSIAGFGPQWWARLDGSGSIVGDWRGPAYDGGAMVGGMVTQDGGFLVTGWDYSYGSGYDFCYMTVCRNRPDGSVEWCRNLNDDIDYDYLSSAEGSDAVELADGTIAAVGENWGDLLLVLLEADGTYLWNVQIDEGFSAGLAGVEVAGNGNILVVSTGLTDALVAEIDLLGLPVWGRRFAGSRLNGMSVASDGSILLAGQRGNEARLVKLSAAGDVVWDRVHGGSEADSFDQVDPLATGMVVAGTRTFAGEPHAWFARFDANGLNPFCSSAPAADPPQSVVPVLYVNPDIVDFGIAPMVDVTPDTVSGTPALIDECLVSVGTTYCNPATVNSTGQAGRIQLAGSQLVEHDLLVLSASQLPPEPNIGYFIMGTGMNVFTPPGSAGAICVTPGLKRFLPAVSNTTEANGGFSRSVGTAGPISGQISAGSTWNFQAWHRDQAAGTSNLTDAVSVSFL